jgi:hypothetical protein
VIEFKEGPVFNAAEPEEVIDFLRTRRLETFHVFPEDLTIVGDGNRLYLNVCGDSMKDYPVRDSFFRKVLKWFNVPRTLVPRLEIDTLAAVLNDLLLNIRSGMVTVKIENGDALTVTSAGYNEMSDLEVLSLCEPLSIRAVSRNDFFLRVYSEAQFEGEARPGDVCSFSYNVVNSETGFRALSLGHYIFRYFCSNGAVVPVQGETKRVHYGGTQGALHDFLSTHLAGGEELRKQIMKQLQLSVLMPLNGETKSTLMKINALIGQGAGRRLLRKLPEGSTRYDLFNTITEEAKRHTIGIRLQLESIAGMLLMTGHEAENM